MQAISFRVQMLQETFRQKRVQDAFIAELKAICGVRFYLVKLYLKAKPYVKKITYLNFYR